MIVTALWESTKMKLLHFIWLWIAYNLRQRFINEISILKESQNKGIGKKILEEQLKENHEKGIRTILQVFKDKPAKKLYEQLGFKVYRETETHYQMEN